MCFMTAFAKTDIPDNISTLEQLAVWVNVSLNNINPVLTAKEGTDNSDATNVYVASWAPYLITATSTPTWRSIGRFSIPLASDWQKGGRIWLHAEELSSLEIPVEFKA